MKKQAQRRFAEEPSGHNISCRKKKKKATTKLLEKHTKYGNLPQIKYVFASLLCHIEPTTFFLGPLECGCCQMYVFRQCRMATRTVKKMAFK